MFILVFLTITSCSDEDDIITFNYTFNNDKEGFKALFAEYPIGDELRIEKQFMRSDLPESINLPEAKALKMSSTNISDDIFMFVYKKITGLNPNTTYQISYYVEIASKYPKTAVGIGGSSGSSVFLKVGAIDYEPQLESGDLGYEAYLVNFDKGNQASGGDDMIVIGNIGIPEETDEYQLIARDNADQTFSTTANADGDLWIVLGTDSGFEGTTTIYYNQIRLELH